MYPVAVADLTKEMVWYLWTEWNRGPDVIMQTGFWAGLSLVLYVKTSSTLEHIDYLPAYAMQ